MSNPIDEFLEFEKQASLGAAWRGLKRGFGSFGSVPISDLKPSGSADNWVSAAKEGLQAGRSLRNSALVGAGTAAGAAAIAGIGVAAEKIYDAVAKRRDFRQMMETDPSLGSLQQQNPRLFNSAYTSLRNVNPTYGRDPVIAASTMHRIMDAQDGEGSPYMHAGAIIAGSMQAPRAESRSGGGGFTADVRGAPIGYKRQF